MVTEITNNHVMYIVKATQHLCRFIFKTKQVQRDE